MNWKNCANTDIAVKAKRVVMGFFIMLAGAMGVKRWLGHVGTILKSSQTWGPKMGFGREVSDRKMAIFISWRVFSRMRSEGFPFIVGGLGVGPLFAASWSARRFSRRFRVVFASFFASFFASLIRCL